MARHHNDHDRDVLTEGEAILYLMRRHGLDREVAEKLLEQFMQECPDAWYETWTQ